MGGPHIIEIARELTHVSIAVQHGAGLPVSCDGCTLVARCGWRQWWLLWILTVKS